MLLGGYVGKEQAEFGQKALRLPAKAAPEAVVRVVGRATRPSASYGEAFGAWLARAGGPKAVGRRALADLDEFPDPEDRPGVLRGLRRDRPVRQGDRRVGVRGMMSRHPHRAADESPAGADPRAVLAPRGFTDDELAELERASSSTAPASR